MASTSGRKTQPVEVWRGEKLLKTYHSIYDAALKEKVSYSAVFNALSGKFKIKGKTFKRAAVPATPETPAVVETVVVSENAQETPETALGASETAAPSPTSQNAVAGLYEAPRGLKNDALSVRIDTLGPYLSDGPAGKYFLFLTERVILWGGINGTPELESAWYAPKELVDAGVFTSVEDFSTEWIKPDSFLRPYCVMRVVDIDAKGADEEKRLFMGWKKDFEKVKFDYNPKGPWWFLHTLAKERDEEREKRRPR